MWGEVVIEDLVDRKANWHFHARTLRKLLDAL